MSTVVQPDIIPVAYRRYRLDESWSYTWREWTFSIPAGFEYDGASIPRGVMALTGLTPDGLIRAAALLHDALYRYNGVLPEGWCSDLEKVFSREEADLALYEVARAAGVGRASAALAYYTIRWFGGYGAWRRRGRELLSASRG